MKIETLDDLIGRRVVVTADHGTLGYFVARRHLDARRIGAVGKVLQWVPGHGGDVVSVEHENTPPGAERVATYCYLTELEFYSDEAAAFARAKAAKVADIERALTALKQEPFSPEVIHAD